MISAQALTCNNFFTINNGLICSLSGVWK